MKNRIIVRLNKNDVFFKYIKDYPIMNYYNVNPKNIFYRICMKFQLPYISIFLQDWKNKLLDYDEIILFDNGFQKFIPKYIKSKNKNIKIILWLWNSINNNNKTFLENKFIDEFWTFDEEDAKKYNINYNTQFYTNNIKLNDLQIPQKDILFLGKDKNREKIINNFKVEIEQYNFLNDIRIIKDDSNFIKYEDYIKMIENSKAILEIIIPTQNGLTLRSMESIFLNRKLITNNKNIKKYDFYDKNNIFILGEDNIKNIKKFINEPYKKIESRIVNYYDFKSWIKRFD